uniref:Germ cell nuclear acidic peptidase n=1 Tax=Oryzias latipes TaxID=8090 RepID=A0A3P9M109_ORYLA
MSFHLFLFLSSVVLVVSSDDEDDAPFETFLQRVKTPTTKPKRAETHSGDCLKDFIVDDNSSDEDFIKTKPSLRGPKKGNTPAAQHSVRRPLSQLNSPVFVSDSEDEDDNIIIRSSWKLRHSKPIPQDQNHDGEDGEEQNVPPSPALPPSPPLFLSRPPGKVSASIFSPKRTFSAPSQLEESSSSEEEFVSLLERLKKKNIIAGASCSPKTSKESNREPVISTPPVRPLSTSTSKTLKKKPQQDKTPAKNPFLKPTGSQTEPRRGPTTRGLCKTPGCFLEFLSDPGSCYSSSFKKNKEQLTSKLYQLYNSSVFDNKLPVDMSVTWNKKMRKTAGYCVTGQEKGGGSRYARIELSEKVCDSADRLRDTLIHELCHAATWLINGVRDGHGAFWKLYACKATVLHPELPMVTRCHSYDITYKFRYQCTRCQNTIGRHSKSLDTQKFVCALCTGRLVLMTPSKPRAPTPFANFVKENYGSVRQELAGQSHAEVMRKLSTDFASKTKLSDS